MDIKLTPELERRIQQLVESGLYESPSEVVRDGLRLLLRRNESDQAKLEALRRDVQVGLDQLDRSEGIVADDAFFESIKRKCRERLAERERKSA